MSDDFDHKLVASAFTLAGENGWRHVSVAAAAREAGLDMGRARAAFSGCNAILRRFGQMADAYALNGALTEGPIKDRLFDTMLRRFDYLQMHRAGVLALLRGLPLQPELGPLLANETLVSMGWLLEAAGVSSSGIRGQLRKRGLLAVWGWGLRAWMRDETTDLSATMAAVDVALLRADQIAARFAPEDSTPPPEDLATEDATFNPEPPLDPSNQ